jgi:hypothetical protein
VTNASCPRPITINPQITENVSHSSRWTGSLRRNNLAAMHPLRPLDDYLVATRNAAGDNSDSGSRLREPKTALLDFAVG